MAEPAKHNRLMPWYIGIGIVAIGDAIMGYLFFIRTCSVHGATPGIGVFLLAMVYGVLPLIYLTLMYLALKSQP